jgi:hypothetical protein
MFLRQNITPFCNLWLRGLLKLSLCDGDGIDVLSFYKSLNSKGCAYMLADSWSSVKAETLHKAWRKLFGKTV